MVLRRLDNGDRVTLINESVQIGQCYHMGMATAGQNQSLFHRFLSGLKQPAQQLQMGAFLLGNLNQHFFAVIVFGPFRRPLIKIQALGLDGHGKMVILSLKSTTPDKCFVGNINHFTWSDPVPDSMIFRDIVVLSSDTGNRSLAQTTDTNVLLETVATMPYESPQSS
jgi:hypothetical protein